MKAKDLSSQLSGLIGSTSNGGFGTAPSSGMSPGGMSYEDSIPEELQDPEPIFEMNYKSEQRQAIKKAKDSITIIVKEVVPESSVYNPPNQNSISSFNKNERNSKMN